MLRAASCGGDVDAFEKEKKKHNKVHARQDAGHLTHLPHCTWTLPLKTTGKGSKVGGGGGGAGENIREALTCRTILRAAYGDGRKSKPKQILRTK